MKSKYKKDNGESAEKKGDKASKGVPKMEGESIRGRLCGKMYEKE
jgi:hypothetical protein